jgi:hypothetical protein
MNRFRIAVATLGATLSVAAVSLPQTASAAPWQSINQRQVRLDQRIDQGIRNGSLTRREAVQLRGEFRQIVQLENRYRRSNGLSLSERRDLDRRFDGLSQRVRYERHDRQDRPHRR